MAPGVPAGPDGSPITNFPYRDDGAGRWTDFGRWEEHFRTTGASLGGPSDDLKKEGSGTITVDDKKKSGKVTFKGKTKANVTLEGTIDCHQVMRGEG